MPSPVPPGYTRGPILFMAPAPNLHQREQLLQYFWDAAGAYGARIVLVALPESDAPTLSSIAASLCSWDPDAVTILTISNRADARVNRQELVDAATGVLLVVDNARTAAACIGGTPFAQALRRANAHGKAVGAYGNGMALLCQHMLVPPANPALHASACFAPGLGLVNRLALETSSAGDATMRLQSAVACNPFLAAAALEPGAGVAVYADTTLACFGAAAIYLAIAAVEDGEQIPVHALGRNDRYNFDAHHLLPNNVSDIADSDSPILSGF